MKKTYYITTPIYYASGSMHIGHSYTSVAADAMARYKRMQGYDVMFLTGTDEHGQKVEQNAKKAGLPEKAYVDNIVQDIKKTWEVMDISYDRFIRTTDDYHVKSVQKIFKRLYESGDIYKGKYQGLYCTPCEAFWTEGQLEGGRCPDCGREVKSAEEDAYFFRLSRYADRILKLYEDNPEFIQPVSRRHEMINNFIKPGLQDTCVSRTSFTWGIPVDFDPGHVVYVWIDALSNYITAMGYEGEDDGLYKKYWPADLHLVGKEIVRFHTILWPAMLMALGEPLPIRVFGHGWVLLEGGKMSKSKGNVIDPVVLCQRYGRDAIRYFLLREIPFGSDGIFSNEALINRMNADLANDLGNLVSRVTAMARKYFAGKIPGERRAGEYDADLERMAAETKTLFENYMDALEYSSALGELFKFISRTNKYIDETEPWLLAKNEGDTGRLAGVMYHLCEAIRIISVLLAPAMPDTAQKIQDCLGISGDLVSWESAGRFGLLPEANEIQVIPPLFPRIDVEKELGELEKINPDGGQKRKSEEKSAENVVSAARISFDDFTKVELRVAKVTGCKPVKRAKKLLELTLDDGTGNPRTVVSGIAQDYIPADLIGKNVVLVANLKPAVLCGVQSDGMILAADCDGGVRVLFAPDLPAGARLR